jgi:hypothetical protein
MVDVLGVVDLPVPTFGIGTGQITILFSIFLVAITGGIIIYLVYDWRIFNKRIVLFENIGGYGFQPVFKDKARLVKLGSGGEELLFLKKKKVYRSAYGRKMGKNTYWFAVGQDGYWYNVVLGDIDAKMGMLDIEPVDRDMRYMHVAIRKNIEERYRKQKFMEKYGTIVMSGMFLLIMIIGIWFLLDKIAEISKQSAGTIATANEVQKTTSQILSSLDNICSGGSGLKSTNT